MQHYKNLGGDSGIEAYEYGQDYIIVQFKNGTIRNYKYTYASAGSSVIEIMKQLADQGHGLNSYIGTNKPAYASKW
ncbi:MAG: hypothetical protein ACOCXQ_02920 [Patescibacteria group bacterium]